MAQMDEALLALVQYVKVLHMGLQGERLEAVSAGVGA